MSSDATVVPIWSKYRKSIIWKSIPTIGSIVVVAVLFVYNLMILENEALLMDSILPILESHRFDNLLISMTITSGLGILAYFILAFLTKAYLLSVSETSDLCDLLERVKTRMGIDIELLTAA